MQSEVGPNFILGKVDKRQWIQYLSNYSIALRITVHCLNNKYTCIIMIIQNVFLNSVNVIMVFIYDSQLLSNNDIHEMNR